MQAQILMTLAAGSLKGLVDSGELALVDIPEFTMREFDLRGLNVPASMFTGCSLDVFDRLRDNADKVGCPVLILVEDVPLNCMESDRAALKSSMERIQRLALAANRLGCNSVAISCSGPTDDDQALEATAAGLKKAIAQIDDFDLNLLIAPTDGMTDDPDRLTDLIKKVGGFRIGSYPSFAHAHRSGDAHNTLRKLAPYAGGLEISARAKRGGEAVIDGYEAVESVLGVGYQNTIALSFEGKGDPVTTLRAARRKVAEALGQLDEDDLEELLDSLAEELNLEGTEPSEEGASDTPASDDEAS
ncbi:MAG: TIM barrel protein [Planctomycetota bacterium]|nr:TIM barrel protein [Planctomycetota bacterium]